MLSELARAAGYAVSVAEHGREAWDALQLARIPVVISDWCMPEMDGPELCRRIRARQGQPYVYFVLITSCGGKQQYLAGMEAGADVRRAAARRRWPALTWRSAGHSLTPA